MRHQSFSIIILLFSGISIAYIIYPLATILAYTEPRTILESLTRQDLWDAFLLSLTSATISTLLIILFGVPLAYLLARHTGVRGKFILRVIIIIPLVLPPLASGALLLGVFGPNSILVQHFSGIEFTQSILGVIIAQTYVASPFMILASQAAFESMNESYEKVARTLGKSKLETFFLISLPLAKTGIIIGIIMSWIRAVGELGATMMMAYNPHTISIQIFEDNAIGGLEQAVSGIILLLLLAVMIMVVFYISGTQWHEAVSLRRSENSKS